ncbi:hypothetical protein Ngar_c09280 [Candidatus Nitrososphaera gargensis Ga9.2]|uniref:Uncharacterized protein n=1 Tax=Nitrososphaera gargensis (strain Ga9.2) TaxID=1237085 RepID=K0IDS0_NITGG|nr:hypothetical protein Ngar_c09280 [Candidatus Nitrososphaera gargensis Ga9.2]
MTQREAVCIKIVQEVPERERMTSRTNPYQLLLRILSFRERWRPTTR